MRTEIHFTLSRSSRTTAQEKLIHAGGALSASRAPMLMSSAVFPSPSSWEGLHQKSLEYLPMDLVVLQVGVCGIVFFSFETLALLLCHPHTLWLGRRNNIHFSHYLNHRTLEPKQI
jgi:hypothetical protein